MILLVKIKSTVKIHLIKEYSYIFVTNRAAGYNDHPLAFFWKKSKYAYKHKNTKLLLVVNRLYAVEEIDWTESRGDFLQQFFSFLKDIYLAGNTLRSRKQLQL